MSHKKKVFDITLVPNDNLRPWTIDNILDERINEQVEALEKTISCTSPQKRAGVRGDSILDGMGSGLANFEKTLRQTSTVDLLLSERRASRESSRGQIQFSHGVNEISPRALSNSSNHEVEVADEEYITSLQRSMLRKSLSSQKLSKSPLSAIRYTENRTPAVLNVSHTDFERLKLLTPKN